MNRFGLTHSNVTLQWQDEQAACYFGNDSVTADLYCVGAALPVQFRFAVPAVVFSCAAWADAAHARSFPFTETISELPPGAPVGTVPEFA